MATVLPGCGRNDNLIKTDQAGIDARTSIHHLSSHTPMLLHRRKYSSRGKILRNGGASQPRIRHGRRAQATGGYIVIQDYSLAFAG